MAGSIICGVDESESAKGAERVARVLAGELGLGLVFVRVIEGDAPYERIGAIAERLERLSSAEANELDCGAAWLVEAGHPADRLVAAAAESEAAMIVIGSTGPRSSVLRSTSADVSRRAPCPVVIVPPGADCQVNGTGDRRRTSGRDRDQAGGIVRLGLGSGGTDITGGIVRFSLG